MQSFPGQVNTGTAVTGQTPGAVRIRYDPSYLRTLPGRLKCAEVVLNILGFICVLISTHSHHNRSGWFNFIAMTGFWMTGLLLAFYSFHIVEKFDRIPWLKIEFFFCAFETVGYLVTATLVAGLTFASTSLGVAALFGFVAMSVYGFDCWDKFKALKNGDYPQGQRPSSKPISAVGTPVGY